MTDRRKKLTPEELELVMVPEIQKALYPVFFPVEQQCVKIQARNAARVWLAALEAWRSFAKEDEQ